MVVKDNRLFAIATYGAEPFQSTIHVMDCAAPAQPVPIGVYKMAKRAHALAFFERYALIANGYGGLQMVDALVPSDLKPISSYTAAEVADVAISNGFIFIAANSAPAILSGLRILQFRPNTGISEVGRFAIPAPIQRVAIDSDRAYVTDAWHGIWVIDITNKANPTQPGFYGIEYAKGVAVCDGFIYVAGHIMGYLSCNPLRDNNCQAKGCPTMACTGLASPRSARLASR